MENESSHDELGNCEFGGDSLGMIQGSSSHDELGDCELGVDKV
jgi:hypothetical protein